MLPAAFVYMSILARASNPNSKPQTPHSGWTLCHFYSLYLYLFASGQSPFSSLHFHLVPPTPVPLTRTFNDVMPMERQAGHVLGARFLFVGESDPGSSESESSESSESGSESESESESESDESDESDELDELEQHELQSGAPTAIASGNTAPDDDVFSIRRTLMN